MNFAASTKARMGYQTAMGRPRCGNCHHVQETTPSGASNDLWRFRCSKGGFGTSVNAVCGQHQPVPKGERS